jgi:hypothetical protein
VRWSGRLARNRSSPRAGGGCLAAVEVVANRGMGMGMGMGAAGVRRDRRVLGRRCRRRKGWERRWICMRMERARRRREGRGRRRSYRRGVTRCSTLLPLLDGEIVSFPGFLPPRPVHPPYRPCSPPPGDDTHTTTFSRSLPSPFGYTIGNPQLAWFSLFRFGCLRYHVRPHYPGTTHHRFLLVLLI